MADLYKTSGVDIKKGESLVNWLQNQSTLEASGEVVSGIGGFAGLFRPNFKGMTDPLLISGTDGVGTKVLLALEHGRLEGLGVDLVAMCVNDLYCVGGKPLFFLDYYATGVLNESHFKTILEGIRSGLSISGCALMGGETAELPGLYAEGHLDLAGFVVGVVDGPKRLLAENVEPGDVLVSLASSGFHSNGYSLIRKLLEKKPVSNEIMDKLLAPTKIYSDLPKIVDAMGPKKVHAVANITGGGISGNLPRVMPKGTAAIIRKQDLPIPAWMNHFFSSYDIPFEELEPVFNLGAGMVCIIHEGAQAEFLEYCKSSNLLPSVIGHVDKAAEASADPKVNYL